MKKENIFFIAAAVIIIAIACITLYKPGRLAYRGIQDDRICSYEPPVSAVPDCGSSACPTEINEPQTAEYNNIEYNFSFSYPKKDVFSPLIGYQYVANNSLARVDLPEGDFAGTNLGEASFIVGASRDEKAINACLKSSDEENTTSSLEIINGTEMNVFNGVGVGAGNIYETKSYRAVKNNTCYEATLLLHSGNIGNYEPGAVEEFNREKAMNGLIEILNTFKIGGEAVQPLITEAEARAIAEETCIKGGESLAPGIYNENSKTWWFDANLNATREGCNPACVVSGETREAEINWRCTGLIDPVADECQCPQGYRKEGEVCNPECYYSTPPCLAPSFYCEKKQ